MKLKISKAKDLNEKKKILQGPINFLCKFV
jgi:hypothetical protein